MKKQGAELTLTVIIVAILALLVLVVLTVIFLGRSADIQRGISDCGAKQGVCGQKCNDPAFGTEGKGFPMPSQTAKCPDANGAPQVCCVNSII